MSRIRPQPRPNPNPVTLTPVCTVTFILTMSLSNTLTPRPLHLHHSSRMRSAAAIVHVSHTLHRAIHCTLHSILHCTMHCTLHCALCCTLHDTAPSTAPSTHGTLHCPLHCTAPLHSPQHSCVGLRNERMVVGTLAPLVHACNPYRSVSPAMGSEYQRCVHPFPTHTLAVHSLMHTLVTRLKGACLLADSTYKIGYQGGPGETGWELSAFAAHKRDEQPSP